ncbi:MAG: recombinase family protein [Acidimicrobiales bacterium]
MTIRFAFYGRVSTEDQQDPTSSKQWQMSRATAIFPKDGAIVAEYFDIGQSRSLPWKRRPESLELLEALKRPDRGFGAVVIGEPARAFYGGQFGLTFPVFTHHDVELWVPEVGGRVDPGSDAHEMLMGLYGGMSKSERGRIKIRVKSAMEAQARHEGRFLGGRPPYGYQLADAGAHPNPGKAADGKRLHRLERDPIAAPIVERIFTEYVAGGGVGVIAEDLNRDGVPSPSGHDPARNRHRAAAKGAWGKSAIRAILTNPRYTGRQVWNRQRRDEELLDVDDVAAGYQSRMRWNDRADWVWSTEQMHEALVSAELFARAAEQRSIGEHRQAVVKPRRTHTYCLSSLVHCGVCGRRMSGSWNHDQAHYRCGFPNEYAGATGKHPRWVYLKEADVTPARDGWLLKHFDPENIDATIAAMVAAQAPDDAAAARAEAARRRILDCDDRLAKYRAALDKGADPEVVAGWMAEVGAERLAAQRELDGTTETAPLTGDEVRTLVQLVRTGLIGLAKAPPAQRAAMYATMGLRLTYYPEDDTLDIESRPAACTQVRVGGGT